MRRPTTVELMLLATVLLWSLNLSATKYVLENGLAPLAYATVRYGLAGVIFVALTLAAERSLRIERRHLGILVVSALALWLNQMAFVYAVDLTTAATIGLLLGAIPIAAALLGVLLGRERLTRRFWLAAAVSFVGVALVAVGAGEISGGYAGIFLGLATATTWAVYSVAAAPLMRTYSASRVSAAIFPLTWTLVALSGLGETREQSWDLGWEVWSLVLFATLGPLVLTTIFWFRAISKIGPARATLAANLQPFVAAILAVVLLSEPLGAIQVAGGVLIAGGILIARRRRTVPVEGA